MPGCFSAGEMLDEAIQNAQEARLDLVPDGEAGLGVAAPHLGWYLDVVRRLAAWTTGELRSAFFDTRTE